MKFPTRPRFTLLVLALAAIQMLSPAASANEFTVRIVGKKQGAFRAPKTGATPIFGYTFHAGLTPDANGNYTGFRKYQPIVIRKDLDLSSPQILQALATNEELSTVVLQAKVTTRDGAVSQAYTITLTKARIVDLQQLPDEKGNQYEEVGFLFQSIKVENGGVSAADDFSTP